MDEGYDIVEVTLIHPIRIKGRSSDIHLKHGETVHPNHTIDDLVLGETGVIATVSGFDGKFLIPHSNICSVRVLPKMPLKRVTKKTKPSANRR